MNRQSVQKVFLFVEQIVNFESQLQEPAVLPNFECIILTTCVDELFTSTGPIIATFVASCLFGLKSSSFDPIEEMTGKRIE